MLPGATVPRSLADLLAVFRPCFTAPTFPTFVGLVVGLIAQTRRRTVCGMLTGAGLEQVWHHSRAHRLFANARWSGDALGLALADLIVARLLPADSALTIAVDDTLFKRSGKKVFGVAWHHDGAAKGPKPIGFGNCWVVAGIVVQLPFLSRPVCLPVLARLWRPRHTGKIAHARELAELIAARYPDRTVHVVGDAAYVGRTPARRGRPDHLDQPVEGHLGAARAAPAPHRTLGATPHPRRPVGHPGRCRRPRDDREHLAHHPGPSLRPHRHRADHRTGLSLVRIVSQPNRAGHSGARRQAPDSRAVTTAVMGFRWSPPISNLPRKIWWPVMRRGGESSRPSPTPARSSASARPAIGHVAPWNGRCRSG